MKGRRGPPTTGRALTQEALDRLLEYLGPNRAEAGERYELIRRKLIRLFEWRGATMPEELADETINRVARKIVEGVEIRSSDPYRYFCGVAFLVFKETLREKEKELTALKQASWDLGSPSVAESVIGTDEPLEFERRLDCLRGCLERLPKNSRRLILDYYGGGKHTRILARRRLAAKLGIGSSALRLRAHRIRQKLEACVAECLRNPRSEDNED